MARLLDCEAEEVEADPLAAVRTAAERFGSVALIKGQYSHIVHPDGRAFRFEGGGVGLATSGRATPSPASSAASPRAGRSRSPPLCGASICTARPAASWRGRWGGSASWRASCSTCVPGLME
jgi:hypothetical protein